MPLLLRVLMWFSALQIVRQYFGGHWERYLTSSPGFYSDRTVGGRVCSWGSWTPVDCCIAKTRSIEALAKCAAGFQCEDWPEEDIFRAHSRNDLLTKAVDHFDIPTPATTPEVLQYLEMKQRGDDQEARLAYRILHEYRHWREG
jgi:hypothetical protein